MPATLLVFTNACYLVFSVVQQMIHSPIFPLGSSRQETLPTKQRSHLAPSIRDIGFSANPKPPSEDSPHRPDAGEARKPEVISFAPEMTREGTAGPRTNEG